MACAAVVIGSATTPVQEVIESGRNGLLVDFFNIEALAQTIASVLADPQRFNALGQAARQTVVDRYDLPAGPAGAGGWTGSWTATYAASFLKIRDQAPVPWVVRLRSAR